MKGIGLLIVLCSLVLSGVSVTWHLGLNLPVVSLIPQKAYADPMDLYSANGTDNTGVVYGVVDDYSLAGGVSLSDIKLQQCSVVDYSAVDVTSASDPTLVEHGGFSWDYLTQMVTAAHNKGKLTAVNLFDEDDNKLSSITSNSTLRAQLVTNIANLLSTYDIDIILIDWEANTYMITSEYNDLINDLYVAINPSGKLIDLYFSSSYYSHPEWLPDASVVNAKVNYVSIGFYEDWNVASLVTDVFNWLPLGYEKSKIVVGTIFDAADTISYLGTYSLVVNIFNPTDSQSSNVSSTFNSHTVLGGVIYWQSPADARAKVDWIKSNGLGGMICFPITHDKLNDSRSLLRNVYIEMDSIVAPTITTQPATLVEATTARLNGNLTNKGKKDCYVTVHWGTSDGGTNSTAWSNNATPTSPTQPQGVEVFYFDAIGLPSGTTIYVNVSANNIAGTNWSTTTSFLTKPAYPIGITATNGTSTSNVTVSWNPSTGASNYNVARDGVYLGPTGNVTSYVDTGANPPVITPGTAIASDGTSNVNVSVSLSGTSVANGTIHTYAVMAINASGNSTLSPAVGGYRGHGALTYQWQISAGDSDANYSDIGGATSSTYTNTSTPSNVGRYWRCVLNATGATQQISLADRGYRSNTPFKGVANSLLALILLVVGIFVIFKVFAKKRRERNKSS